VALGSGHNERSVPVTRELPILFIGLLDLFNDRGRGNCLGVPVSASALVNILVNRHGSLENATSLHAFSLLLYASAHNKSLYYASTSSTETRFFSESEGDQLCHSVLRSCSSRTLNVAFLHSSITLALFLHGL
jgi:hypothetical protein